MEFEFFFINARALNRQSTVQGKMAEELLGGGLDIDGWSYLKNDVQGKINEMTDRSLILRSTFPLIMRSKLKKKEAKDAYELVVQVMEMKRSIEPPWIGKFLAQKIQIP